jgi:Zn finger protein HypA/HybF involved in hydrogenase expression
MFVVENKFDIDEEVYLIKQVPVKYDCPVCQGKGRFVHNNYEMKCPKCHGEGKLCDDKIKIWEVMDGTYKIYSCKVNFNGSYQTVRYKVSGFNRAEENIFKSKEDAQKKCFLLNTGIKENNTEIKKDCNNCSNRNDDFTGDCYMCQEGIKDCYMPIN